RISGLFLLAIIMTAAMPAAAQEYSVSQSVLLPPEFYVGDSVEMRLTVRVGRNETLTPPKSLPTSRWIVFHSVRVVPHGDTQEVRISFTPYHPGTLPFPAIELGHVVLKDISVYVKPVLSGRPAELQSAFRQLLLPNTRLLIGSAVGVLLVIPLLWFGFYRFGRERVAGLLRRVRENRPYRRLLKYLKSVGSRAGEMRGREFYIELLAELRLYLTRRLGADCSALTTSEIEPNLGRLMLSEAERAQLTQIFRYGDLVKFAGRAAPVRQRKTHIDELITIVSASASRAAERSPGSDTVEPTSPRRPRHARLLSHLLRRRGYVPTFHREAAPDRKERKQHVDS
ncbi:MAG TPA: hypothetical protein VMW87_07145, partial [Spirochaetia bacterium]|nr:hypothetical protein [Spirochaetia bacterium]